MHGVVELPTMACKLTTPGQDASQVYGSEERASARGTAGSRAPPSKCCGSGYWRPTGSSAAQHAQLHKEPVGGQGRRRGFTRGELLTSLLHQKANGRSAGDEPGGLSVSSPTRRERTARIGSACAEADRCPRPFHVTTQRGPSTEGQEAMHRTFDRRQRFGQLAKHKRKESLLRRTWVATNQIVLFLVQRLPELVDTDRRYQASFILPV